jgi:OPA family sugar phosphate sensor protein UhpC-like MFS transporter
LVAYAIGQFIWGIAGDRAGPRKIILIGLMGSVVAAIAMGASSLTILLGVFFCLQGLFQSTGWAPLVKNVGNFFSQHERGVVLGFWTTNYALGGMVASLFAGYWGDLLGWRYAFFIPAATLLLVWIVFLIFQRNRPEDVGLPTIEAFRGESEALLKEDERSQDEPEGSWHTIREVLTNRNVLLLSAVYFLIKPTRYAILFWGPKYINEKLGTGMAESGLISGMFELAGILSVVLGGYVSDRFFGSRRMPVSVMSLLVLGVVVFLLDDLPATPLFLGAGLLAIGFFLFAPDGMVSGVAAVDFGTKKGASTAAGLINGFGSIGAIAGGTIPGLFVEYWGWKGVFTFLAVMVFAAGLVLLPKWNALPPTATPVEGERELEVEHA